jgi:hypothetical protein
MGAFGGADRGKAMPKRDKCIKETEVERASRLINDLLSWGQTVCENGEEFGEILVMTWVYLLCRVPKPVRNRLAEFYTNSVNENLKRIKAEQRRRRTRKLVK